MVFLFSCPRWVLGVNYLIMTTNISWGGGAGQASEDFLTNWPSSSDRDITLTFAIVWSVFTSTTAFIMLVLLQNIVSIAYISLWKNKSHHEMVEKMIVHMECRFAVGALIGVCTAWALTDALVGLETQIV